MGYTDIIERLAAATAPSRELDARVYGALYGFDVTIEDHPTFGRQVCGRDRKPPHSSWWMDHPDSPLQHFTSSADAVKIEAEKRLPGVWWISAKGKSKATEPLYFAQFLFGSDDVLCEGKHDAGEAFALLIALFRALERAAGAASISPLEGEMGGSPEGGAQGATRSDVRAEEIGSDSGET